MQRHKNKCTNSGSKLQEQRWKELEDVRDSLDEENKQLREELAEKSEITYNLCIKFLRMKHAKDTLRQKFDQLHREHLRVMEEMMEKLDEAREELNVIVSEKFQEPLPVNKAKFLQVINLLIDRHKLVIRLIRKRFEVDLKRDGIFRSYKGTPDWFMKMRP